MSLSSFLLELWLEMRGEGVAELRALRLGSG